MRAEEADRGAGSWSKGVSEAGEVSEASGARLVMFS